MNSKLVKSVIFPFYHWAKRTQVLERLHELRNQQWMNSQDLSRLQNIKLELLLSHAYENVPFYRSRFEYAGIKPNDFGEPEVLNKIPLLSKQDILSNEDLLVSRNAVVGQLIPNSTSGSTGEALRFFTDMKSWACRRALMIRNQEWLGIHLGDRQASLWGASMDIDKGKKLRGRLHNWINNMLPLSSYDLKKTTLYEYVDRLNRFRPKLLTSYPGPLTELAQFMLDCGGLKVPSICSIISSAETLFSWQKEIIETAFSKPVFNRYGCREFGDIAHECERREGLHINADRLILEIIDEDLVPVRPLQMGEIVITDLDNYGMPLIRYRIGDRATISDKECSCGRGLPLLHSVEGRSLDVVRAPNGNALGGTFWTLLFRSRSGIRAFQVVQEEKNGIVVNFVSDEHQNNLELDYFSKKIMEQCGEDFLVKFNRVDSIEKTTSGKTRFVISNLEKTKESLSSPEDKFDYQTMRRQ